MTDLRLGLVGLGGVCAAVHYPGFSRIPGVDIVGVCEPDADLLAQRQSEWGLAAGYQSLERLLGEAGPDAVAIATPNLHHQALIEEALAAGCHVLCEKPLGMDLAQTIDIYQAGKASGKRHMTAFTYRFVPGMNYLRHLVQSDALGQVRHARFQRLQDWGGRSIGWRQYKDQAGSGELGDMGIHRIDYAEDLLGPIVSVCGASKMWEARDRGPDGQPCPPQDVEDWIAWIAEFESGASGVFEMGKLTKGHGPGGDHDLAELNGTQGSAAYRLHTPHEIMRGDRQAPYQVEPVPEQFLKRAGSPRDPGEGDPVVTFRYDQAWEFVSAIGQGRECLPSFYHGMRAQAVADAILSAVERRCWVDVPACPA